MMGKIWRSADVTVRLRSCEGHVADVIDVAIVKQQPVQRRYLCALDG